MYAPMRELEGAGAVDRVVRPARGRINLAVTQQCLKQFIDTQVRKITIDSSSARSPSSSACVAELKQKKSRQIVVPRQIAMYPAKQMTEARCRRSGASSAAAPHHGNASIAKIDEQRRADRT